MGRGSAAVSTGVTEHVGSEATFAYRAVRVTGESERGVLVAASADAAGEMLASRGLYALELRRRRDPPWRRRAMPVAQLALGLRVLADFLEAGLPLARALAALEGMAPARWRAALPAIRQSVKEGRALTQAFGAADLSLPPLVLGIVEAGEAGSGLAPAVRRAAELTEEMAAMRAAIRSALAYPTVLAVTGCLAIGVLVGVVLPRFAAVLGDLGQSLPPSTRLVLRMGDRARALWPSMVVAAVAIALAWRWWTSGEWGGRRSHSLLLALPVIGPTRRSAALARECAALAALLDCGVPLSRGLAQAARAGADRELSARLIAARADVVLGSRLSSALTKHAAATDTVVRLVQAGEESGRLAAMLHHAARLERANAATRTQAFVRLLEPSLILVFGALVGLVAAALLQAMYSVRPGV